MSIGKKVKGQKDKEDVELINLFKNKELKLIRFRVMRMKLGIRRSIKYLIYYLKIPLKKLFHLLGIYKMIEKKYKSIFREG